MPKKHKDNDDRRSKRSNTYDPFKDDPFFNQTTEDLPILGYINNTTNYYNKVINKLLIYSIV